MDTNMEGQDIFGDELDVKNLLCDQEEELTHLTEMVRNHYLNYLEKQLQENFKNCCSNIKDFQYESDKKYKGCIKRTAKLLEDKALEACMIAQYYQRAMVKIISIVRRSTQEKRLIAQLEKSISNLEAVILPHTSTKETQTEAGLLAADKITIEKETDHVSEEETHDMTLDEKIEIFQKHLKNGHTNKIIQHNNRYVGKSASLRQNHQHNKIAPNHHQRHDNQHQRHYHHRPYKECRYITLGDAESPTNTIITPPTQSPAPLDAQPSTSQHDALTQVVVDMENSNDSVAVELARLFSEEKTELDEIFGIDPNQEPDDPQICKILKEIEQANVCIQSEKLPQENNSDKSLADLQYLQKPQSKNLSLSPVVEKTPTGPTTSCIDLSKSLWPCELFMQKRKLSESLARLIEEDLRWHDVIKWKFCELFGEDSDDEFTPCSPSIELNEILMGSCVKRISPWVVKHLMKPMKEGLIGNRFIFKKLAKHIARSIIKENQYPDESIIKVCIENYFCLYQAVMTLADVGDVPSISLL